MSVARYVTPSGNRVSAIEVEERANLPVFDVEIVDSHGEVVEHFEITGSYALQQKALDRRWRPAE